MPQVKLKYGVVHYDYPISDQPEPSEEIVPSVPQIEERQSLFMALLTAFFTWLWFSDR